MNARLSPGIKTLIGTVLANLHLALSIHGACLMLPLQPNLTSLSAKWLSPLVL